MGFGGEMNHAVGAEILEDRIDFVAIADVGLGEMIAGTIGDRRQRLEIARIGELVDVENDMFGFIDQETAQGRTDETGPAGYDDAHSFGTIVVRRYRPCMGGVTMRLAS